ncbi:MAG: hypothetical protein JSR46_01840 [Verrucomicrobia bacterium]|nr:hypothetical protein [Verrucomicrobiota bacterium]
MNLNLYGQLHGLSHAIHRGDPKNREENEQLNQDIEEYADLVVADEREHYQPNEGFGVEGPEAHFARIRQQVIHAQHEFYQTLSLGYKAICEALTAAGEPIPEVSAEGLALMGDHNAFYNALRNGAPIYELLGFSPETMDTFHKALNTQLENQDFDKARSGYFFMNSICPERPDYWKALGQAEAQLGHYEEAEAAYKKSLNIYVNREFLDLFSVKESYLDLLSVYVTQGSADKRAEANAICNAAITYAQDLRDKLGGEELYQTLLAAKNELK